MAFQPFSVQCLTCSSRLRVTDPSLVGTISACPKCGSMVEITGGDPVEDGGQDALPRAPEQVALGADSVDSETITRDAISAAEIDADHSVEELASYSQPFQGSDSLESAEVVDTAMPISPDDWQSDRTRKSRQLGMIVAVSIATLLIAVIVFAWFVRTWSRSGEVAAVPATEVPATEEGAEVEEPIAPDATEIEQSEPNREASAPTSPEVGPAEAKGTGTEAKGTEPVQGSGSATAKGTGPAKEGGTSDDHVKPPATMGEVAATVPAANSASVIPADLLPIDPLGPMPPVVNPDRDAVPPDAEEGMSKLDEIPPELRKFTVLLDLGREANETKPTIATPPSLNIAKIENAAEESLDPMMIATPPPAIDMDRALALEFALNSKGYPLGDLVLLFSQLTGVPVQIDWMTFDLAQKSIGQSVPTPRGFLSAGEQLEKVAESVGATLRVDKSFVLLTIDDATFAVIAEAITGVEDFAEQRSSAIAVLGAFLESEAEPNAATVRIGASLGEQQLAVLAFESLRRMRNIQGKVEDEFLRRWAHPVDSPAGPWTVLAAGDSGPALDAPVTIAELLRRVARRNQATCLVNWFDASRRRLSPEQIMMPYVQDDAGTMLSNTLRPFEMQVRRVDEHHWWVGTEATYDRLMVVVWSEPLGDQRGAFMKQITELMSGQSKDVFRIAYDQVSDRVMMLLPRYIVRQLPKIQQGIAAR
ncbi:hypothetical protein [Novipirellula galeiformis]|nr:hypothetical protein [Novipirellula galeiformis]